jgi:hypothetical protein
MLVRGVLFLEFSYICFSTSLSWTRKKNREDVAASPEESTTDGDSSDSGEEGSSSSGEDSDDGQASGRDESSPKVDVMG